ncbi:MAG: NYN domain-containing protein [Gemmataceae bacterium]
MMLFLVDGYNLMHVSGHIAALKGKNSLRPSRDRFLNWIADQTAGRGVQVLVVFDAQEGPAPSPETLFRTVRVRFAYRHTADDQMEQILKTEPKPRSITVVSNDRQVQEAGRRRDCRTWDCERFIDWLCSGEVAPATRPEPKPEKPDTPDGNNPELLQAFDIFPKKRSSVPVRRDIRME